MRPPAFSLPGTQGRRLSWPAPSELTSKIRSAGPTLLFGLRLWVAVCLALYIAFWLELDNAQWAGTSAAVVCQPSLGASLRKGSFRMIGTIVGAVAIVILTACFPQSRTGFLLGLALLSAACGLVATLLRNFSAYAVVLAGCTAAIIASDELGATGGASSVVFTLAITRRRDLHRHRLRWGRSRRHRLWRRASAPRHATRYPRDRNRRPAWRSALGR
jgi:uncharacterized membrane protein YgaE (UPF0421/DUF939 family)